MQNPLVEKLRRLQEDRARYRDAIVAIDEVLCRINEALRANGDADLTHLTNADIPLDVPPAEAFKRRRGRFTQTATESILALIRERGNPSTADINAHWRLEGRRGTANVTIMKLLKQDLIRRESDPSIRGSRYVMAPNHGRMAAHLPHAALLST